MGFVWSVPASSKGKQQGENKRGGKRIIGGRVQNRFWEGVLFRKILVSVKFVSAILGPEMAAPIVWTPGQNAFFLQENPCPENSAF